MRQITKEDFIQFPEEVTTLPVFDNEDGQLIGWGHIPVEEIQNAFPSMREYHGMTEDDYPTPEERDISHTYAKPFHMDGLGEDEIAYNYCLKEDDGAFPITVIY